MDHQPYSYNYTALDSQRREIRVINFESGDFGETLKVSLAIRSLDAALI